MLLPFWERVSGPQYVLEIRNGEWLTPEFLKTLRQAGISLALSDFRGPDGFERKTFPHVGDYLDKPAEAVTGSVAYIRLIGDRWTMEQMTTTWKEQIVPRSSDLQQWAGAILEIAKSSKLDIYAYVNNHYAGHGPESARQLIQKLGLV